MYLSSYLVSMTNIKAGKNRIKIFVRNYKLNFFKIPHTLYYIPTRLIFFFFARTPTLIKHLEKKIKIN